MKKLICVISVFALLCTLGVFCVNAALAPMAVGEVDLDNRITVKDATLVQKFAAKSEELTFLQLILADADDDGKITVKDATLIQKHVAKLKRIDRFIYPYVDAKSFYHDYDSGKAMAGVPVTFTVSGSTNKDYMPLTYEFYVNDVIVGTQSEKNTFTYTFKNVGKYKVEAKVYNACGFSASCSNWDFEVVAPYESEKPVITGFYTLEGGNQGGLIYYGTKSLTCVCNATGGKGDYEYAFLLNGELVRDYSKDNTFVLTDMPVELGAEQVVSVRVKDSASNDEFTQEDYVFVYDFEPPA